MFKFVEAVFTAFTAIYNTDNNTIIYNGQTYTYEEFDEEFFIHVIETIDEYNFREDLQEQYYRNYLYDEAYIQYYDPTFLPNGVTECYSLSYNIPKVIHQLVCV